VAACRVSAVLANERASCFVPGDQGGTYNGNPLMIAAARSVFAIVSEPAFLDRVVAAERTCKSACWRRAWSTGSVCAGRGLLWALVLPDARASQVVEACFSRGLLLNTPRPNLLRLMPSLRVSDAEIDEMVAILERALRN